MGKTFKDMTGMKSEKKKDVDPCISCVLVARQTGIIRNCRTCELSKAEADVNN